MSDQERLAGYVEGHLPLSYGVSDHGRGRRRTPPDDAVTITGDRDLGRRLLDTLAVTP